MADIVRPAWMSNQMYQEWLEFYLDAGGEGVAGAATRATELFRDSPTYEGYFPGIKREDGQTRFPTNPEQTYYENIQAFRNTVEGLGLNPDVFNEDYIDLIRGDSSPNEFAQRVSALESRVMSQGPAIRDWYAQNLGIDFTREGILASLMSERVDQAVLSKQMTMAEIGGEGVTSGFDLSREFVNMLANEGMNRDDADRMFGSAERMLPTLQAIAARNGNPNDAFDITEFAAAAGFGEGEALAERQIDIFKAQESSVFTGGGAVDYAKSRNRPGISGLTDV